MKRLFFRSRIIEIIAPSQVKFENSFDEKIYNFFYQRIETETEYRPLFSCEELSDSEIDLISIYNSSSLKIKKPSKKADNPERLWRQHLMRSFLSRFPVFTGLVYNNVTQADIAIHNAEILLGEKVSGSNFIRIKQIIDEINQGAWNRERDTSERNSGVSTLGTISEKLLQIVFSDLVDNNSFFKVGQSEVQTYGDFVLMCLPNNLWISVKSNFARERLLASGFTNDILGAGFFQDASEFTGLTRIRNFQRAGFLAMYCPDVAVTDSQIERGSSTYQEVYEYYRDNNQAIPTNINGKPFIRKLSDLYSDLSDLLVQRDIRKRSTVNF